MKRRLLAVSLIVCLLFSTTCSNHPELFGDPPLISNPPEEIRAISLKALQTELRACQPKKNCSPETLNLAGINTVMGFVTDEANRDLLLFGQAELGLPPLHLEDFVVALRNVRLKYARVEGNTRYLSFPGCTIDPVPQVMQELRQIEQRLASSRSIGDTERTLAAWRNACQKPQTVGVMGIPFSTHFARVMVKADYDMKTLADGADALDTPGFISLTEMALRKASNAVLQHKPISQSLASLDRFWFYPGENVHEEDQGIVFIKQCSVELLTEEMYSNASGQIGGTGTVNPRAQRFAENFTAIYEAVAFERPVYRELENLFRFVSLAGVIESKIGATIDLNYLLEEFPIAETPVDKSKPGRFAVKDWQHTEEHSGGSTTLRLWFPSCGGVNIAIDERKRKIERNSTGTLASVRKAILANRPSSEARSWSYRESDNALYDLKDNARLRATNQRNQFDHILSVEYKPEGVVVRNGDTEPLYSGKNLTELSKRIEERLGSPVAKSPRFDFKNFPEQKVPAFMSSYGMGIGNPLFRRQQGAIDAREILHTPGVKLVAQESGGITQEAAEGQNPGWFKLVLKFLVRVKDKVYQVTLTVWTRTQEQAQFYWTTVQGYFSDDDFKAESLEDCGRRWDLLFRRQFPGSDVRKDYRSQFGNIQISRLTRARLKEVG